MNIQNNILKYHLRNVLFVCGNACGGKTTMSRLLAQKYGFPLYDMDEAYNRHRAIADELHQPDTCYHMTNFHEQWTRPPLEQAKWNLRAIAEQTEMVLVDLMQLAQDTTVVADVLFSPAYTREIVDDNHIVFLTVDRREIRNCYFNRPEKREFYEFVKKQPLAELYFENLFQNLEWTNDMEQEQMRKTGFFMLERRPESTTENTLKLLEDHFGLTK
ncbi:MAG: hypothetical protein ACI4V1_07550 [Eubacteriales bacterium]